MENIQWLGFSKETVNLISPFILQGQKGELVFPFSYFKQYPVQSMETLFMNKTVRKATDGLFIVELEKDNIKLNTFYFDSVLSLLCFYETNNRNLFRNSLFVVVPIVPQVNTISLLLDSYKFSTSHTLVFTNDIRGYCLEIMMLSYINGNNKISIALNKDNFDVSIDCISHSFPIEKYNIKQVISAFGFDVPVTAKRPKGFNSYIDKFYSYGR